MSGFGPTNYACWMITSEQSNSKYLGLELPPVIRSYMFPNKIPIHFEWVGVFKLADIIDSNNKIIIILFPPNVFN